MRQKRKHFIASLLACTLMATSLQIPVSAQIANTQRSSAADVQKAYVQKEQSSFKLKESEKYISKYTYQYGHYNTLEELLAAGAELPDDYWIGMKDTIHAEYKGEYSIWIKYCDGTTDMLYLTNEEGVNWENENSGVPSIEMETSGTIRVDNNGAIIRDFTYAKGHFDNMESLSNAPNAETVSFNRATGRFHLVEDGEYTIGINLWDGTKALNYVDIALNAEDLRGIIDEQLWYSDVLIPSFEHLVSVDGGEFSPYSNWVTEEDFESAIATFNFTYDIINCSEEFSLEELKHYYYNFTEAYNAFVNSIKVGTGDAYTVDKQGATILIDSKMEPLYYYSYAKGNFETLQDYLNFEGNHPELVTAVASDEPMDSLISFTATEPGTYTFCFYNYHVTVEITDTDLLQAR